MEQYHNLLKTILKKGTWKEASRANMPRSISYFGHQMRFNLQDGFPIVTTKKVNFNHIVTELLWFLRGDTNIKYLVDNGCNIWNEDAYNYYVKVCSNHNRTPFTFDEFITFVKQDTDSSIKFVNTITPYKLGDCGKQYGWLWRNWEGRRSWMYTSFGQEGEYVHKDIDQVKDVIEGLKKNPEGRRHIISAWNPATLDDMALPACHSFVQFNCRKLTFKERCEYANRYHKSLLLGIEDFPETHYILDEGMKVPKYYLDCQLYQRSGDSFLGIPYNISSYALLTHIIAKICNMEVGEFIHTIGDAHIYENHLDQVSKQLSRDTKKYKLPTLKTGLNLKIGVELLNEGKFNIDQLISGLYSTDFELEEYESYPSIKAPLSTGLK